MGRRTASGICRKFEGCDSRPIGNTGKFTKMYINFTGGGPAVGRLSAGCRPAVHWTTAGPPPTFKKIAGLVVGWLFAGGGPVVGTYGVQPVHSLLICK